MHIVRALALAALLLLPALALAKVNINAADAEALQTLDGIGPAKAQAIVDYRQSNGAFGSVDELTAVDGIGAKTLEGNRDAVVVE